jgi:ribosomal protein S18 acetylase RimI-like enzyme
LIKGFYTHMFSFRLPLNSDYQFCKEIGHEGLRPYIEKLRGWDQAREDEGFNTHWDMAAIKIIQVKGEDVGYFKVLTYASHVFLEGIYIHRCWRDKGLGRAVIRKIINEARRPVRLNVYKNNPAYGLYKQIGFTTVGESETRYHMEYPYPPVGYTDTE